eukprot:Opistho-2@38698
MAPLFSHVVLVTLVVVALQGRTCSAVPPKSQSFGGKVDFTCLSTVDLSGGAVNIVKDAGSAELVCKTLLDDGSSLLSCGGRYVVENPAGGEELALAFKLDNTVDEANYIVARIESTGKVSIVLS